MQRRQILVGGGVVAIAAAGGFAGLRHSLSMTEYDVAIDALRAPSGKPGSSADLIRYATLAANGHNTQPWRFKVGTDRIDILSDLSRRTPSVDPDDHHLFVSLGCAAENLSIAARACGRPGDVTFDESTNTATFVFGSGGEAEPALFEAIGRRQSSRTLYDGRPVAAHDLLSLANATAMPGVRPLLITDRSRMDRVRDLVVAGNTVQMNDAAFVRELKQWLRFNPHTALRTGDGLFTGCSGNPLLPDWLGPGLFDLSYSVTSSNEQYGRQIRSSAGLAVFVSERIDQRHWFQSGRACQRFALQATALGIKHAFINQPVEVAALRPDLASVVGMPGRRPDLLMRFGYGPALPFSARRPILSVMMA